jgi:hypothetical protein
MGQNVFVPSEGKGSDSEGKRQGTLKAVQEPGAGKVNGAPHIGTRLADNWSLPDDWQALAQAIRPDWSPQGIVRESITFRDYWTAKPGKDATKVDWLRTWRTWIRKANAEPLR